MLNKLRRYLRRLSPTTKRRAPYTNQNPDYAQYSIGDWTYGTPEILSWDDFTRLSIGKFCSIGPAVVIALGGEHRTDWATTFPFNGLFDEARSCSGHPHTKGDIVIGNDVWIGYNTLILSGVTIGNGAVIGARSVVAKDVAPYAIVAGNPVKQLRRRFSEEVIESLQRIAWWDWPIPKIVEALPLLLSPDIQAFVNKYDYSSARRSGSELFDERIL